MQRSVAVASVLFLAIGGAACREGPSDPDEAALANALARGGQASRAKVEQLLQAGVSANTRTEGTPVLAAVSRHGDVTIVRLLLRYGADPNLTTARGNTALHLAIVGGHRDVVAALLEGGADPSIENGDGKDTLALAREAGRAEILTMLEAAVASPRVRSKRLPPR